MKQLVMKRLATKTRARIMLFVLIISAVMIGNLVSHLLLRHDVAKMSAEIAAAEKTLLQKLDKLEKDNRYQKAYAEQAQKEAARLQRSIDYHQGLMDRAKTSTTPASAPAPAPATKDSDNAQK